MNKKTLSESGICDKFIRPAIEAAGGDGLLQIYREFPLRAAASSFADARRGVMPPRCCAPTTRYS